MQNVSGLMSNDSSQILCDIAEVYTNFSEVDAEPDVDVRPQPDTTKTPYVKSRPIKPIGRTFTLH